MASTIITRISHPVSLTSKVSNLRSARGSYLTFFKQGSRVEGVCAVSSVDYVETAKSDGTIAETRVSLACPVCYEPLNLLSSGVVFKDCSPRTKLKCSGCKKSYYGKETHLELTNSGGGTTYADSLSIVTELFRLPLVSFAYERGWRQNFVLGGFPGPEKEFEMMKEYLSPVSGGNIVDASCGSGLFARIFAKSEMFSLVVALDYSESMLDQCYEYIKQDDSISKENIVLTRSDIVRLPFVSCSVDAVHAGAAIHCWPSPISAVAEICRVLKPGGVFVGTTSVFDGPERFFPLLKPLRQGLANVSGSHFFLSCSEIEDVCKASGLVDFTFKRNRQFIMFSARKQT